MTTVLLAVPVVDLLVGGIARIAAASLPGMCLLISHGLRSRAREPGRTPGLHGQLLASGIPPGDVALYDRATRRAGSVGVAAYSVVIVLALGHPALGIWMFFGAWSLMHWIEFRIRRRYSGIIRIEWEYPWPDLHHPLGTARGALVWTLVSGLMFMLGLVFAVSLAWRWWGLHQ